MGAKIRAGEKLYSAGWCSILVSFYPWLHSVVAIVIDVKIVEMLTVDSAKKWVFPTFCVIIMLKHNILLHWLIWGEVHY